MISVSEKIVYEYYCRRRIDRFFEKQNGEQIKPRQTEFFLIYYFIFKMLYFKENNLIERGKFTRLSLYCDRDQNKNEKDEQSFLLIINELSLRLYYIISNCLGKKIGLFSRTFNVPNAVRDIIK